MAYYDTKQAAVDPDNPAANEQIPYAEWNAMVSDLRRKIHEIAVDITALGNDKVLVYKTASSSFVMESPTVVDALVDLTDVTISGVPSDNEVLAYDSGTSDWINQTAAEAGLATLAGLAAYLPLAGGTMAGTLNMGDHLIDDVDNIQAYDVDGIRFLTSAGYTRIDLASTTYSFEAGADASMNGYLLHGVGTPTSNDHASNKGYDDAHLFAKEAVTSFLDGYIPIYRTSSGKFEMEEQSAALGLPVVDTTAIVCGSADGTKLLRFEVDGFTSGTTRVATFPNKNFTVCGTDEVMLLSGVNAMGSNLDMDGYDLENVLEMSAAETTGIFVYTYQNSPSIKIGERFYSFRAEMKASMQGNSLMHIGALCLNDPIELTIASGVVTATQSYHTIDTESDAGTDDLDTIDGGTAGMQLTVTADNGARTVVVKNATGNLRLSGDMSLDNAYDTLELLHNGSYWMETGRSNNGA